MHIITKHLIHLELLKNSNHSHCLSMLTFVFFLEDKRMFVGYTDIYMLVRRKKNVNPRTKTRQCRARFFCHFFEISQGSYSG